jgi:hypothetical protein
MPEPPEGVHLHLLESPTFGHDFVVTRSPGQTRSKVHRPTRWVPDSTRSAFAAPAAMDKTPELCEGGISPVTDRARRVPVELSPLTRGTLEAY